MNPAEEFIKNKVEDVLTFNSFDHKRQYPINEQAEWLNEFAQDEIRNVLLGLMYEMQDTKPEKHYDLMVEKLKKYPRK